MGIKNEQKQLLPHRERAAFFCQNGGVTTKILFFLHDVLWGPAGAGLLLAAGAFLSIRTCFPQFTLLSDALRILKRPTAENGVSPFQALCTALAATVGTGNIIGVTGAICLGGPGAVFWIWVCGFLGMATKFGEVTLASRYRVKRGEEYMGGPMYMITRAMPERYRFLAVLYSIFGVAAAFGVGNATQINAVVAGVNQILGTLGKQESFLGNLILGTIMAAFIGAILLGGVRGIGSAAEKMVPAASVGYFVLCLIVIFRNWNQLPGAVRQIVTGAFSPGAVTGGGVGSAFLCLSVGMSRGIFTNEAGMGTASMAYCASSGNSGVEMGILGLLEVFVDTIVICTLTALAVLCSGIPIPYGLDCGTTLAPEIFRRACGDWAAVMLTAFLCVFALATVLGWGLYGTRCGQFLFGDRFCRIFVFFQMAGVVIGAVMKSNIVWVLAETVNALMAIPNIAALIFLNAQLREMVLAYKRNRRA